MTTDIFKTRLQIADEIGVSYSTLRRKIKSHSVELKGNLIPPGKVKEIKALFGLSDFQNKSDERKQMSGF